MQDGSVLHTDPGLPCLIGEGVTIGHGAIVHGAVVEDDVTIGMGAIVLSGARIGKGAVIAAGALVPEGREVPAGSVVMGVPAKERGPLDPERKAGLEGIPAKYVARGAQYRATIDELRADEILREREGAARGD